MTRRERLSGDEAAKDVWRVVFQLPDSGVTHEPGDALGVHPLNDPALVAEWLAATRLSPDELVDVAGAGQMSLEVALTERLEIARITPQLLEFVTQRSRSASLMDLMQPSQTAARADWLWGRLSVDLLNEYPVIASTDEWLGVLKSMKPRTYSISSAPHEQPGELQLTIGVAGYGTNGRQRPGVCSTFLAQRAHDAPVRVFIKSCPHFRLPSDPSTPSSWSWPRYRDGTGIAPFRGYGLSI